MRQVVEAAVTSARGRFACTLQGEGQIVGAAGTTTAAEEDEEMEDLFTALDKSLVLREA